MVNSAGTYYTASTKTQTQYNTLKQNTNKPNEKIAVKNHYEEVSGPKS
jgi:hypothetical protein